METLPEFSPFAKISRLNRECIVTEKIDGTNAQILITEGGEVIAGSRNRWLSLEQDNFGFCAWVQGNKEELLKLGPGRHFGEWWGLGIQRGYGLHERRFSLFNVSRWNGPDRPACCRVVPEISRGNFEEIYANFLIRELIRDGSQAAPGFMKPEGIIIYHTAARMMFKKTCENDDQPKTNEA